jgi:hypothetical protein
VLHFDPAMGDSSSADFKITFQLDVKDVYKSNVAIIAGNIKRVTFLLWAAGTVTLGSAAFAVGMRGLGYPVPPVMAGLWGILFLPMFLIWMCYIRPYFASKSLYKNNINLHNPIHYSFSDALITQEMASGRTELQWATFTRVRETRELFLFYVQKHLAHPIPKRAFANELEIERFRELVRRHIQDVSLRGGSHRR